MRAQVGFVSGSVVRSLRPSLDAMDIVVTGKYGALEPWWHTYTDADRGAGARPHGARPASTRSPTVRSG